MNLQKPRTMYVLCVLTTLSVVIGCNPPPQQSQMSIPSKATTEEGVPIEMFVFVAKSERERISRPFKELLLHQLAGGSLVHLIECPKHQLIATVDVPFGNAKTRSKNPAFRVEYQPIHEYFEGTYEGDSSDQLGMTAFAETVENIRRTDMKCRVLLCGSPIYHDEKQLAFSTRKFIPSDGLLGHPHSPWLSSPLFPENTQVAWLTESVRFGNTANHRKGIARFNRLFIKTLNGHLVRITPDPSLAFSFADPHLKNDVSLRHEKPKMINPDINTTLGEPDENEQPTVIPIETKPVSFSKKGTFKYEIEMLGGDPESLSGEAIVLWLVVDGSGSMSAGQAETNQTILKIAESLPSLVKSLEIGIAVHRNGMGSQLPVLQIEDVEIDGGVSLRTLRSFLESVQAVGGDAMMQDMLEDGMQNLGKAGVGKRQFMMLVADYVGFGPDSAGDFDVEQKATRVALSRWCSQSGTDRRVVAMYSGVAGEMEEFFRDIGATNSNSIFSRQPNDLIRELLSAAIPQVTGGIK